MTEIEVSQTSLEMFRNDAPETKDRVIVPYLCLRKKTEMKQIDY